MKKNKTAWYIGGGVALVVVIAIVFLGGGEPVLAGAATLYKSPTCDCCGIYANHVDRKGLDLQVTNMADVGPIGEKAGVPPQLRSCHTTFIGDYFIEGHVPVEAIQKLLAEQPDIKGIALPGMPSGTPGMPGPKLEPWVIYAIGNDGSISEFMTI